MTFYDAAPADGGDDVRPLANAFSVSDAIGSAVVHSDDPDAVAIDALIVAAGHLALVAGTADTAAALRALAVEYEGV